MFKNNAQIVLVRGLPGAGKSTLAMEMAKSGFKHFEADQYFEVDGVYTYDQTKVSLAHDWCVASAKAVLAGGQSVVISNTFVKTWEMKRYTELGYPFKIIELECRWKNIHGIADDKIAMMASRWQKVPPAWQPFVVALDDLVPA